MKITYAIKNQIKKGEFSKELLDHLDQLQKRLTDPVHIARINKLIPQAVMIATGEKDKRRAEWIVPENSKAFHAAMNNLTKAAGLRSF
ncbi:MAG: hypothetical protein IH612_04850 [Desulfofustis sp.]|nr:hypothetical protein [Desulfofustis sp.]